MSEQNFLANRFMLAGYRDVEPWLPDDVQERFERESERNRANSSKDEDECPF